MFLLSSKIKPGFLSISEKYWWRTIQDFFTTTKLALSICLSTGKLHGTCNSMKHWPCPVLAIAGQGVMMTATRLVKCCHVMLDIILKQAFATESNNIQPQSDTWLHVGMANLLRPEQTFIAGTKLVTWTVFRTCMRNTKRWLNCCEQQSSKAPWMFV